MHDVPGDLVYEPLHRFEQRLVMPPGHPLAEKAELSLADIGQYGLILPPMRQITWRLVDLVFQQARVPYSVALEVGGWEVIKQYVAMGMGISILSSICLTEADRGRIVTRPLDRFFPARSYGVVMRKGRLPSPQARAFMDLIQPDLFLRRDYYDSGHSER